MMQTDLETLRERVLETARMSPVGPQIEAAVLESDRENQGADFLRVILQLKLSVEADDTAFEDLLEAIESTVDALDGRYPSVRFSDAA